MGREGEAGVWMDGYCLPIRKGVERVYKKKPVSSRFVGGKIVVSFDMTLRSTRSIMQVSKVLPWERSVARERR